MSIVRFDPFRELDRLQSEVNRLFEGYSGVPGERSSNENRFATARTWSPAVDVAESPQEIVVRAALPGVKENDIDIELTGDTLTLRGERKFENEEHKDNFVRVEHAYGRFQRSFTLATPIQSEKVTASYTDGVLQVHLPKSGGNKPRKIEVKGMPTGHMESAAGGAIGGEASESASHTQNGAADDSTGTGSGNSSNNATA